MKRLLVTGGSGFVGTHILRRGRHRFYLTAAVHQRPLSIENVATVPLDLDDARCIDQAVEVAQPDVIIHTAAWVHPDACEADPALAHHRNAVATEVLAEAAERLGARLIFCSTDMVFEGAAGQYSETSETRPVNVYGQSKLTGEKFVQSICSDYAIARLALVYGPSAPGANSFSEAIRRRIAAGENQPLFTDQYRSPVLVTDLADALLELAESQFVGLIHLGGAQRTDRYTFGQTLARIHGLSETGLKPVSFADVTLKAPRPVDASLNTALAQSLLSTNLRGYEEGLKEA